MPYRLNAFTGDFDLVLDSVNGAVTTQFDTDSGSAVPTAGGVITITGGTGLNTSGSANTVTINLDDPVIVDNGGTGRTSLTDGAILVGDGSNPVELVGPLTDGQLLIGDTAGVSPVAATLTAGTGISITNAAGSITLDASATTPLSFPTDSGTAIPAANALTVSGGNNCSTSGAGATLTIDVDATVADSFATDSGTATPALGVLTVTGGTLLNSSGAGSTVTINADDSVAASVASDSGTATPASNSFSIVGTGGITTSAATSIVTIDGSAISDFDWNVETGTTANLVASNGYIGNNAAGVTFTLPATCAVGDTIKVTGLQASWTIAQNASQTIHFGASSTTTGVGGSLASTDARDVVEFICVVANTDFQVISSIGNITVV